MLVRILKSNQPLLLILVPLAGLLFWAQALVAPVELNASHGMPLYRLAAGLLAEMPALSSLIAFGLLLFQAIYLNHMLERYELLPARSWLPAWFFLLTASLLPEIQFLHPMAFVNTLLVFIAGSCFSLYKTPSGIATVLNTGMLIGLACLFYLPACILLIYLGACLWLFRTFIWREWLAGAIGFCMPWFLLGVYYFWNGYAPLLYLRTQCTEALSDQGVKQIASGDSSSIYLFGLPLAALFFLSLFTMGRSYYKQVIKTRLFQQAMLFLLLLIVLSFLPVWSLPNYHLALFALPASVFIPYFFLVAKKRWLTEGLFLAMLLVLIFAHLLHSL